jgi:DNA-binding winged helix-turn-helix (wHTH) protein/tetratricopeptide (TPR) repeat protein
MQDPQPHMYEFGEFRLDVPKHLLLKRDGKPVPLTPRVFDMLLHLVVHSGALLDKEELLKAIWPDTVVEENNLNQCISALRRVLGDNRGEHRYIVTVPGRGYRFVADVKISAATTKTSLAATNKTLAVLPFRPLVEETRDSSLEMGMADTLIARLSGREMIVRPISSVRTYVDLDQDPLAAGYELGVEYVLDGSLQRWGDYIRITARLISVASGAALWAGTFDEKFTDIFAVQDAISEKIASALALPLSGEEKKRLTRRYTENAEAYELYLKARYHLNKLTPPEVPKSISYFQQAIAFDPSYALAYVGLADAYRALALSVDMPATEFFPKSKAAAGKAIEIDDHLAEAHAVLGFAILFYDWDWDAAESQYKRALELNPNSADSHLSYAALFSVTGRYPEALAEIKRARELDPLNLRTSSLEGQFLTLAGQIDEGLARLQRTFELEPNFFLAHLFAASAYIKKGMYAEAIAEATRARDLSGGNAEAIATIGYALAMSGEREEARAVLDELNRRSTERYVPPYNFALIYNGLGERDEAIAWLELGVEQRDPKMIFLKVEPKWDDLRDDPRFVSLLDRMKLLR